MLTLVTEMRLGFLASMVCLFEFLLFSRCSETATTLGAASSMAAFSSFELLSCSRVLFLFIFRFSFIEEFETVLAREDFFGRAMAASSSSFYWSIIADVRFSAFASSSSKDEPLLSKPLAPGFAWITGLSVLLIIKSRFGYAFHLLKVCEFQIRV